MGRPNDLRLVASGHRHPSAVLESGTLEQSLPNVEPGFLGDRLGMKARRVAMPHERLADYGIGAVRDALERAGWGAEELDLIVCGAVFLEDLVPARASVIAESTNPAAVAFDVNAACASFLYALAVAGSLVETDPSIQRAAVCVVERPTASSDYRDSHSAAFWGDSAGAVLIQQGGDETGFAVESLVLVNDGLGSEAVRVPRHGVFHHDNREAFRHVMIMGEQAGRSALDEAGIGTDDVRVLILHQANEAVLSALGERLGIPWERQWHNFEWAGNQGASGILTALSEGWNEPGNTLAPGDRVLLTAVGAGYSAGAAVLRWLG